jgi:hypothetical protein
MSKSVKYKHLVLTCSHMRPLPEFPERNMNHCQLKRFGGRPPIVGCVLCLVNKDSQHRGLGDVITKVIGVIKLDVLFKRRGCGRCSRWQTLLNKLLPFHFIKKDS